MSKSKLTLAVAGVVSALSMGVSTQNVEAANWLMLQGTEKPGAVGRAKVWGFVQAEATYLDATKVPAAAWKGNTMQPNTVGPDRSSRATMNIRRARIGVRGQGFPLDNKVNYFMLAEFGHNGVTSVGGGGGATYLTDASVTLNHIPYARVRIGQFKTPGAEEGLQAIHVFDYTGFTAVTDQLLMERFTDGDGSTSGFDGSSSIASTHVNKPNGGVGAFRDVGVQLFDTIKMKKLEYSYAFMIGNGNGINRSDNNAKKDFYGYLSTEMVFGGKGGRREGAKLFAWTHKGKRTLTKESAGEYDRNRTGVGFTFKKAKISAAAEYIMADGLIRNGTDGGAKVGSVGTHPVSSETAVSSINYFLDGEANGYYAHFGYKVLPKLELDVRYDVLNRGTHSDSAERTFSNITLGTQIFLNKKTRLTFNYAIRSQEAPNLPSTDNANKIGDAVDNLLSAQVLAIF